MINANNDNEEYRPIIRTKQTLCTIIYKLLINITVNIILLLKHKILSMLKQSINQKVPLLQRNRAMLCKKRSNFGQCPSAANYIHRDRLLCMTDDRLFTSARRYCDPSCFLVS